MAGCCIHVCHVGCCLHGGWCCSPCVGNNDSCCLNDGAEPTLEADLGSERIVHGLFMGGLFTAKKRGFCPAIGGGWRLPDAHGLAASVILFFCGPDSGCPADGSNARFCLLSYGGGWGDDVDDPDDDDVDDPDDDDDPDDPDDLLGIECIVH